MITRPKAGSKGKAQTTPTKPRAGMGAGAPSSVAAYLKGLRPEHRTALDRLIKDIRAVIPKAEPCISYGMPAYRHPEGVVVYCAAFAKHISLFPTSWPIEACAADLGGYKISRGTIQIPLGKQMPAALVRKLIRVRLAQMAEKASR